MPYDTPYNRMIANKRNATNQAYSDIHAYSNQMANGRGRFDDARIRFPDRDGTTLYNTAQIINPEDIRRMGMHDGGITHKNMEGHGGVLNGMFRDIGKGVDQKRVGHHRLFRIAARPTNVDKMESDSSSSDEEMEGEGFFDDLMSGAKSLGNKFLEDPEKYINYGKTAYNIAKPIFGKGSMSDLALGNFKSAESPKTGGAQNMSLSIRPFDSPQERAVFRNYEMTSGPIGGAQSVPLPRFVTKGMGISGGKRAPSNWIQHVKAFAASKGMKYRDALRSPECKASYHSKKGGSVIGGPSNDPVNRGKITGLGRKKTGSALFSPKGQYELSPKTTNMADTMAGGASTEFAQPFMKSTGHHWEGATLGAGPLSCFGKKKPKVDRKKKPEEFTRLNKTREPKIVNTGYDTLQNVRAAIPELEEPESTYAVAKPKAVREARQYAKPEMRDRARSFAKPVHLVQQAQQDDDVLQDDEGDIALGMPFKKRKGRKGKGATDFPIITPATIRRIRKETGAGKLGSNPATYTPKNLVASGQSGGMLKQLMKSSSISGGKKGYPANANIHGFGKKGKGIMDIFDPDGYSSDFVKAAEMGIKNLFGNGKKITPEHRLQCIQQIMTKHNVPKTKATKMLTQMKKTGGAWYDDLWSGIKDVASTVAPFIPLVL